MLIGLAACGGGGGDDGAQDGRLSLSITDAPVDDATSVVVQFSGVAFKRAGASAEVVQNLIPATRQIDLLQYQQGRAALLLDGVTLPAGDYEWIRLIVDNQLAVRDSYIIRTTGEECELRVPNGAESGLKLNRGGAIEVGGEAAIAAAVDIEQHSPQRRTPWIAGAVVAGARSRRVVVGSLLDAPTKHQHVFVGIDAILMQEVIDTWLGLIRAGGGNVDVVLQRRAAVGWVLDTRIVDTVLEPRVRLPIAALGAAVCDVRRLARPLHRRVVHRRTSPILPDLRGFGLP